MFRNLSGIYVIWILLSTLPDHLNAQGYLTLNQAIDITLKNNYNIQIFSLQKDIAELGNHPGYAGYYDK